MTSSIQVTRAKYSQNKENNNRVQVSLLKELVEAKFACTLNGVASKSWGPTPDQACHTSLRDCDSKPGANALVLARVCLHVAYKVQDSEEILLMISMLPLSGFNSVTVHASRSYLNTFAC